MSSIHFLNVGNGDCTLIGHNSGHNTLIDICKGNYKEEEKPDTLEEKIAFALDEASARRMGNFGMSKKPTNPISYFESLGINSFFRLITSHPDMDHLDGFNNLLNDFTVTNFWDSGVRRDKPSFDEGCAYKEEDWDRYVDVYEGREPGVKVVTPTAGSSFKYANETDDGKSGADGLYILAPDKTLIEAANDGGDINDGSYVLLYRSAGGRVLIPGDAHDETWDYVIKHYKKDIEYCSVLFAPHHGRKSARSFEFLNVVKPKITFFGCAASGHLAYQAWSCRDLPVITNNQAGNIVLDCADGTIKIYIQNPSYAKSLGCDLNIKNNSGYVFIGSIEETKEMIKS